MSSSKHVHLQSEQALADLRTGFQRFSAEATEALVAVDLTIRKTQEWLAERETYWKKELIQRQEVLELTQRILRACEGASSKERGRKGCEKERTQFQIAKRDFLEAENALKIVLKWKKAFEQSVTEYKGQSRKLREMLGKDVPKASADLTSKIDKIRAFHSGSSSLNIGGTLFDQFATDGGVGGALGGLFDAVTGQEQTAEEYVTQVISGIIQGMLGLSVSLGNLKVTNYAVQTAGHFLGDLTLLHSAENISGENSQKYVELSQRIHQTVDRIDIDKRIDDMVRKGIQASGKHNFAKTITSKFWK